MAEKEKTLFQQLCEMVLPKYAYFVKWYCLPEESRPKWDNYKNNCGGVSWETASEYPYKPDVQKAIAFWMEHTFLDNQLKVYQTMLKKALGGDVNASKFVTDFKLPKGDDVDETMKDIKKRLEKLKKNKGGTNGTD